MSETIRGLAASPGIAVGPAWVYRPIEVKFERLENAEPAQEWKRLQNALSLAKSQLKAIEDRTRQQVGEEEAEIFGAHKMFLDDPELIAAIKANLDKNLNAESAVQDGIKSFSDALLALENEYFQARATDVLDVGRRLIACLQGIDLENSDLPKEPVMIFADDLTPSDTIQFETGMVLGLCTRRGGPTSHTAILARSLGIPALVSTPVELDHIQVGGEVVLDGVSGEVILDPDEVQLADANKQRLEMATTWEHSLEKANQVARTTDEHVVEVVANIGSLSDALQAIEFGAEGVGLLRTEFLYIDQDQLPDVAEQTKIYRQIFEVMDGRPVVVRTLDIGGDKEVSFLGVQKEPNPFLGWRAIRMIGERPEILCDQFKALLQAGVDTDLRIMLPLVSVVNEVISARKIFEEAKRALDEEGVPYARQVQFGIMVEVPAAAMLVEHFAAHVDFFSIGTNDLAQYTLAVDRTNERVASLASPFHPAVLRLIASTIEKAHAQGKWVGLCGEMAGDPSATPVLIGLGLDEFSMAPIAIPVIKEKIRNLEKKTCEGIAAKVLSMPTTDDVLAYLRSIE